MDILLVILISLLGIIVYEALSNLYTNLHSKEVEKEECKMHSWSYNHLEKLVCMNCNFQSGTE